MVPDCGCFWVVIIDFRHWFIFQRLNDVSNEELEENTRLSADGARQFRESARDVEPGAGGKLQKSVRGQASTKSVLWRVQRHHEMPWVSFSVTFNSQNPNSQFVLKLLIWKLKLPQKESSHCWSIFI